MRATIFYGVHHKSFYSDCINSIKKHFKSLGEVLAVMENGCPVSTDEFRERGFSKESFINHCLKEHFESTNYLMSISLKELLELSDKMPFSLSLFEYFLSKGYSISFEFVNFEKHFDLLSGFPHLRDELPKDFSFKGINECFNRDIDYRFKMTVQERDKDFSEQVAFLLRTNPSKEAIIVRGGMHYGLSELLRDEGVQVKDYFYSPKSNIEMVKKYLIKSVLKDLKDIL